MDDAKRVEIEKRDPRPVKYEDGLDNYVIDDRYDTRYPQNLKKPNGTPNPPDPDGGDTTPRH